jgi:HSP20 family protein
MASALTRWEPYNDLVNIRSLMERVFGQPIGGQPALAGEDLDSGSFGMNVYENGDSLVVEAAVPGVDPKDVDISVDDDVLTIRGESHEEVEHKEDQWLRREFRRGSLHRQLRLPPTIDAEQAQAKFENGLLRLTFPKKPEARSRSLKITPEGVRSGATEAPNRNQDRQ